MFIVLKNLLLGILLFFFVFHQPLSAQPPEDSKHILVAEPLKPAAGGGQGTTRLRWQTADGTNARLYLVNKDNSLLQMGEGQNGDISLSFIVVGKEYEFRLYPADSTDTALASVIVFGDSVVDFSPPVTQIYYSLWKRAGLTTSIVLLLLIISLFLRWQPKYEELFNIVLSVAAIGIIIGATLIIYKTKPQNIGDQPAPDVQETVDAARQMVSGNGYVTFFHGNQPQPPRYPPGFSIALTPFLSFGEYPANIMGGAKFFAWLCLWISVIAAWYFGGRLAAILAAFFISVSPFLDAYAGIVMSEAFTSALVAAIAILLYKPSFWRVIAAGAIAGFLITVRLQMIVCLPALVLALPSMRQRLLPILSAAPFLLLNGVYNWITFGNPLKSGYSYWLPDIKPFALFYAVRFYPQGDGPWIIKDVLDGWLFRWICPCEAGGPLAALPNFVFYPLIVLGTFWLFAPPLVTGYGLWQAWKSRDEIAARFVLWLIVLSLPLFTFYFYQGARFMAAISTLLIIFAAVGLAKKWKRFIRLHHRSDEPPSVNSPSDSGDKTFPIQLAN